MCVSINFYFPFSCLLNACHPALSSPALVPLVSIRLKRLWTILCPVSWFLDNLQEKSCSPLCAARAALNLYNSQLASCLPLCPLALLVLVHSASRAAVVLDGETVEVGANFQCTQLGYWVDGCFWRCRPHPIFMWKHKHTVGHSVLVVQTHTI